MPNYKVIGSVDQIPVINTYLDSFSTSTAWISHASAGDGLEYVVANNRLEFNCNSVEICPWAVGPLDNVVTFNRKVGSEIHYGEIQITTKVLFVTTPSTGDWFCGLFLSPLGVPNYKEYAIKVGFLHDDDTGNLYFTVAKFNDNLIPKQTFLVSTTSIPQTPFLIRTRIRHNIDNVGGVNAGNPTVDVYYSVDNGTTWTVFLTPTSYPDYFGNSTLYEIGYFAESDAAGMGTPNIAFDDFELKTSHLHEYDSIPLTGFNSLIIPPNSGTQTVDFDYGAQNIALLNPNPQNGCYMYSGKFADFMEGNTRGIRAVFAPHVYSGTPGTATEWGVFWNGTGTPLLPPTDLYVAYIYFPGTGNKHLKVDKIVGGVTTTLYDIETNDLRTATGLIYNYQHYDPHTLEIGYDVDENTISVVLDDITVVILRDTALVSGFGGLYFKTTLWFIGAGDYFHFTELSRLTLQGSKSIADPVYRHRNCVVKDDNQDLLRFREQLGSRVKAIREAVIAAQPIFDDYLAKQAEVDDQFNQLLNLSPDTTYKNQSLYSNGMDTFDPDKVEDKDYIEERLSRYGINVVNGRVLLAGGDLDLSALRSLAITLSHCDFNLDNDYIFVPVYDKVIASTSVNSCGENKVIDEVEETSISMNITFAQASDMVSVPEESLRGKLYWCGTINATANNVRAFKRYGFTPEEVAAALSGTNGGRITTYTITDKETFAKLLGIGLTTDDICKLLTDRTGPDAIATNPDMTSVLNTLKRVMAMSAKPNKDGFANDTEPPSTLLNRVVDLNKTFQAEEFQNITSPPGEYQDKCQVIIDAMQAAYNAVQEAFMIVQDILSKLAQKASIGAGVGKALLGDGIDCIVSVNLGASVSGNLLGLLGPLLRQLLNMFMAVINAVIAILSLIQELLCIPEAILQLLSGGVCGLRIIDFDFCTDELKEALNLLRAILDAIKAFIAYLLSQLMNASLDFSICLYLHVQLSLSLGCIGTISFLI